MKLQDLKDMFRNANQARTELGFEPLTMYHSMDPAGIELVQWEKDPAREAERHFFKTRSLVSEWLHGHINALLLIHLTREALGVSESPEDLP